MPVAFALLAALMIAVGSTCQHFAARSSVDSEAFDPGHSVAPSRRVGWLDSYRRLFTNPIWLFGGVAELIAYGLEIAALSRGRLTVVQPLLALGLVLALPISARLFGVHHGPRQWFSATCVALGIALLVVILPAGSDRVNVPLQRWVIIGGPMIFFIFAAALAGSRVRTESRAPVLLALATGVTYGLTAALTKTAVDQFHAGFVYVLSSWEVYALVVGSIAGLLLGQAAFRAGPLSASLPVLTVTQRVMGTALGVVLLRERVAIDGNRAALLVLGAGLAMHGVFVLARSQPSAQR